MEFITLSGLTFNVNKKDKTATVHESPNASSRIVIPSLIFLEKQPYKVVSISEKAFCNNKNISSLSFEEDSNVIAIEKNAFKDSSITSISLPESIKELKKGWCNNTYQLVHISLDQNNRHFLLSDNILFGKTEENNDFFDIVLFAKRDIENANIPKCIKYIDHSAFAGRDNINVFVFENESQLISIGKKAFSYSLLTKLIIPSSVKYIKNRAFFQCHHLTSIQIPYNSELVSIGNCSLYNTSIEELHIPSHLSLLHKGWCSGTFNLRNISISTNNRSFVILNKIVFGKENENDFVLKFACRDIEEAKIQSNVIKIDDFSFQDCKKLKNVQFFPNSSLSSIE